MRSRPPALTDAAGVYGQPVARLQTAALDFARGELQYATRSFEPRSRFADIDTLQPNDIELPAQVDRIDRVFHSMAMNPAAGIKQTSVTSGCEPVSAEKPASSREKAPGPKNIRRNRLASCADRDVASAHVEFES